MVKYCLWFHQLLWYIYKPCCLLKRWRWNKTRKTHRIPGSLYKWHNITQNKYLLLQLKHLICNIQMCFSGKQPVNDHVLDGFCGFMVIHHFMYAESFSADFIDVVGGFDVVAHLGFADLHRVDFPLRGGWVSEKGAEGLGWGEGRKLTRGVGESWFPNHVWVSKDVVKLVNIEPVSFVCW